MRTTYFLILIVGLLLGSIVSVEAQGQRKAPSRLDRRFKCSKCTDIFEGLFKINKPQDDKRGGSRSSWRNFLNRGDQRGGQYSPSGVVAPRRNLSPGLRAYLLERTR